MKFIKLTFIFCFVLLESISYSQHRFGVRGGLGISNFAGSDISTPSISKTDLKLDMFYEREFNPTLSIVFELNYDKKGGEYEYYPMDNTTVFVNIKSTYISIPVFLKAYFGHSKTDFYLYTGLSFAKLVNKDLSHKGKKDSLGISSRYLFPYEMNNNDASVNFGFGLIYSRIILDVRYQYGLIDIYKGVDVPVIRNRMISATMGILLYRKKVSRCLGTGR